MMGIAYLAAERVFQLDTPNTTYLIGIVGTEGFLGHLYYGKKLNSVQGAESLFRLEEPPYTPDTNARERLDFLDTFPTEYSGHGVGDFRESSIRVKDKNGHSAVQLFYVSHEIYRGKRALEGLPATFGSEDQVTTLVITCEDPVLKLRARLSYSVFQDTDCIARSVSFENAGDDALYLEKAMSMCLDMDNRDFQVCSLHGSWGRERHIEWNRLGRGSFRVASLRGESSQQEHPFLALASPDITQEQGEVYGFHFVYSGNFLAQAQVSQFDSVRVVMGINPEDFCWKLEAGEGFQAPEAILIYSCRGLDFMTQNLHDLYRSHLIRSPYLHRKRPVLINNWEGTYFDFDEKKLLEIAKESAALGIEMLVMDDGWFGNRFDDARALGDWRVNEEKLKGGLKALVDQVNGLGMKFGMWFEPEMISGDSDLYRAHPDWAFALPDREPCRHRNQYVLDISRREVRDCILERMFAVLHSANVEYVKWDMNRSLSDVAGIGLPKDRQGEIYHRYVLGMYEMQERLIAEFPDLLLENCSAGGARFDPGMLYYSPQIWCTDDTDAIERLAIQEGTAMLYPLSAMGAHVSVCPNHATGRVTPFATRGNVALAGTFGYELDMTKLKPEDKELVRGQVALYHRFNDLIREGVYHRLASLRENHDYDCFQICSRDGGEALVFYIEGMKRPNQRSRFQRLRGLEGEALYRICVADPKEAGLLQDTGNIMSGDVLMNAGIKLERLWGDFGSRILYLKRE